MIPRRLVWPLGPLGGLVCLLLGCDASGGLTTLLNQQVGEVLGQINPDVVIIRVINQTVSDIQVDLNVDGLPLQISCSTLLQVCDTPLSSCPSAITAIQQRSLDAQGRFLGGRNFNGNAAFSFTEGEFDCTSTIVYKFTEAEATAFEI